MPETKRMVVTMTVVADVRASERDMERYLEHSLAIAWDTNPVREVLRVTATDALAAI